MVQSGGTGKDDGCCDCDGLGLDRELDRRGGHWRGLRGNTTVFGEYEKPTQSGTRAVVEMDVGHAASLLGFEKFKEDIDRTNHGGTLLGCFAGCNRWIRKVHLMRPLLSPSGLDSAQGNLILEV